MVKRNILVDLNEVLIEFVVPLMNYWGVQIDSLADYPRQHGWDVKGAIVARLREMGHSVNASEIERMKSGEFWRTPPYEFWRNLKPYTGALEFMTWLESTPHDIWLATAHANGACAKAKLEWIDEYLPKYWDRVLIGHPKQLTATPGSILIDDRQSTCEKFEAAGGIAINMPRPWNSAYDELVCFNGLNPHLGRRPQYNIVARKLFQIEGVEV